MPSADLQLVNSEPERRRLYELRDSILENIGVMRFAREFLRSRRIVGVPFEECIHFHEETASNLEAACSSHQFAAGFVIPLVDAPHCCFRVEFTAPTFVALSDVFVIDTTFLVIEEKRRFAILVDEDINTIAGPFEFVESALGHSVEDAKKEFLIDWVVDSFFDDDEKQLYTELVAYYEADWPS